MITKFLIILFPEAKKKKKNKIESQTWIVQAIESSLNWQAIRNYACFLSHKPIIDRSIDYFMPLFFSYFCFYAHCLISPCSLHFMKWTLLHDIYSNICYSLPLQIFSQIDIWLDFIIGHTSSYNNKLSLKHYK